MTDKVHPLSYFQVTEFLCFQLWHLCVVTSTTAILTQYQFWTSVSKSDLLLLEDPIDSHATAAGNISEPVYCNIIISWAAKINIFCFDLQF